MKPSIDYEETLLNHMKSGINLFTGAGFSILPDPDGKVLPNAQCLAKLICEDFNLPGSLSDNLELASMRAEQIDAIRLDEFLRKIYRVQNNNPLYEYINRISINSYITTNIDNLFQTIIEKDRDRYINSVVYGKSKKIGCPIDYIPLHGDITDPESHLYFGMLEIAAAFSDKRKLFGLMQSEMFKYPTLIWGYGFHDSSVLSAIQSVLREKASKIWVQFLPENKDMAETFRSLGVNIIISDTSSLLKWIGEKLPERVLRTREDELFNQEAWKPYEVPTQNSIKTHIGIGDYYKEGKMAWNAIYSGYPFETHFLRDVYEIWLKKKNTVVIGSPQSGKTTLLRQMALESSGRNYYISEISTNHARKLVNNLNKEINVFFDDCSLDMATFAIFANHPKVHLLGVTDEYGYESSKHLLSEVDYYPYMIPDLSEEEANSIYGHIPRSITNDRFIYSRIGNEKYSMMEFGFDNIRDIISEDKVKKFLNSIADYKTREIILLTAHLAYNNSFLSVDVLWSYIDASDYDEVKKTLYRANEALSVVGESIDEELLDQDYYVLRSNSFMRYLIKVAMDCYREEYGQVIRKLIKEVPRGLITRYGIYRRTAYDATLFYRLFGDDAFDLYDEIYRYDDSVYLLQQKALYCSRNHRFDEAFKLIDSASQEMPNNLSIKNAKAIITFEANRNSRDSEARNQLYAAMNILTECYKSDKRKVYHAQKFAEYAIVFHEEFEDDRYAYTARQWLETIITEGTASYKTRRLVEKINVILS